MGQAGVPGLELLLAGHAIDERPVADLIAFVDARHDCADFRMVGLLTLWYRARETLGPETVAEVRRAILGFGYRMDEPDTDAMCMWSENHQILFAATEYLAGQAFPDEVFADSGFTGRERMRGAAERLDQWLGDRFRFGFSEWLSASYYEEDAAALGLLVEHCTDETLVAKATGVLDLLFLDLALHGFQGRLAATSGRAYERLKKYPEHGNVVQLMSWAFGVRPIELNYSGVIGPFLLGTKYRVPEAIRAIATDQSTVTLRCASGLDVAEVADHYPSKTDQAATHQLWAMEAFTLPAAINPTLEQLQRLGMQRNAFLYPLAPLVRLRRSGLLPVLLRLLKPVTRGLALQRANITTWRSPHALLSSAQQYHPGDFGSQQHLWTLALPGDVAIFAVQPGAPTPASESRLGFGRSQWEGNGINPATGQDANVLLARYDTRGRPGLLELLPRTRRSQLFVPFDRLDEWHLATDRLWVRAGDGCALILADGPIEQQGDTLVRRGRVTGWAVVAASEPGIDLASFIATTTGYRLRNRWGRLRLHRAARQQCDSAGSTTEQSRDWTLTRRVFAVDGVGLDVDHPRFDTPWVQAPRFPSVIEITAAGHRLTLDLAGRRSTAD